MLKLPGQQKNQVDRGNTAPVEQAYTHKRGMDNSVLMQAVQHMTRYV